MCPAGRIAARSFSDMPMTRGLPASGHLQLVAHRADQQAVRRRAGAAAAQQLRLGVAHAGDVLALVAVVPVVAHNPAGGGRRARKHRAVAHRRDRRDVDVVRVGEHRALAQQPRQAALVLAAKTCEVIVAELVDYDRHDQLRFPGRRTGQAGRGQHAQSRLFSSGSRFFRVSRCSTATSVSGRVQLFRGRTVQLLYNSV